MPTFASAPAQYATADESQFRNAVSLAFTSAQSYTNQKAAAAQAAAQAYADTNFYNKVYIDANFLPIGGSAAGTVQALTAGTGLSMTPSGTFNGSVARTLAVTGAPWSGITGTPTTLSGYGITDVYTKTASDARYAALAGPFPWADLSGTPTTLAGYGITDAAAGTAGVANSATKLATARTINGVSFDGTANITLSAAAAAADVTHGTFGSTTSDTGAYEFVGAAGAAILGIGAAVGTVGTTQALQVYSTVGGIYNMRSSNDTSSPSMIFTKSRGTTPGAKAAISVSDMLVTMNFNGIASNGTTVATGAQITAVATAVNTSTVGGKLVFSTTTNAGVTNTALTLDQDQSATFAGAMTITGIATFTAAPVFTTGFTSDSISQIVNADQSLARLQIRNTTANLTWALVAGTDGVDNTHFQLKEMVGGNSVFTVTSAGLMTMQQSFATLGALTAGGALTATTGTFSGNVAVTEPGGNAQVTLNPTAGGAGDSAQIAFQRNGTTKWQVGNNTVAGSDAFQISNNAGTVAASFNQSTAALTTQALNTLGDFAVATSKFTVAASSGNTAVAGTLGVTSDFAVNSTKFAVTASSGNMASAGTISHFGSFNAAAQTTVAASLTGNLIASMPEQGASYKIVVLHCSGMSGSATYTFPTAFTVTPANFAVNFSGGGTINAVSTTSVTITGTTANGVGFLFGY